MATPFLVGLGVAGAAMAAKHGLKVAESLASNPEAMKTMGAAGAGFNRRDETTRRARTSADVGAANVAIALAPAPTRRARGSAPRSDDADLYTCRTIGMMRFEDDVGGGTASTVGVFRRASGPLCLFALVR